MGHFGGPFFFVNTYMTEVGWWYTGLFFVIVVAFYAIGFVAGKNWERVTWEDKDKANQEKSKKR